MGLIRSLFNLIKGFHAQAAHPASARNGAIPDRDIPTIRHLAAKGHSHQAIAHSYGVHRSTISRIVKGQTYKHVK